MFTIMKSKKIVFMIKSKKSIEIRIKM